MTPRPKITVKLPPIELPPDPPQHTCRVCLKVGDRWTFNRGHPDVCLWCSGDEFRGGGRLSSGAGGGNWTATRGGLFDTSYINDMATVLRALKSEADARR